MHSRPTAPSIHHDRERVLLPLSGKTGGRAGQKQQTRRHTDRRAGRRRRHIGGVDARARRRRPTTPAYPLRSEVRMVILLLVVGGGSPDLQPRQPRFAQPHGTLRPTLSAAYRLPAGTHDAASQPTRPRQQASTSHTDLALGRTPLDRRRTGTGTGNPKGVMK